MTEAANSGPDRVLRLPAVVLLAVAGLAAACTAREVSVLELNPESTAEIGEVAVPAASGDVVTSAAVAASIPKSQLLDQSTVESVADWWEWITGLTTARDAELWTSRLQRACDAPIWHKEPAESLVAEFIREDGGDPHSPAVQPGGSTVLQDAQWTLRAFLLNPSLCDREFPPEAMRVQLWRNDTGGLRGPSSVEDWAARLESVCELGAHEIDRDAASELLIPLAESFFVADGGDPSDTELIADGAETLWILVQPPGSCQ